MTVPSPAQAGHGETETNWPNMDRAARTAARPGLPVPVVQRALFGITKHLIGLRDLLEALFGGLVAVVAVGVTLHRELAVRLLDVGLRSIAPHAQHGVIVARPAHSS